MPLNPMSHAPRPTRSAAIPDRPSYPARPVPQDSDPRTPLSAPFLAAALAATT
ncbi:hypothetical protein FM106_27770 [Brachybacterium faecium]|nr:hypothetical protein FM106_27770 [Brachybacterium faecium]